MERQLSLGNRRLDALSAVVKFHRRRKTWRYPADRCRSHCSTRVDSPPPRQEANCNRLIATNGQPRAVPSRDAGQFVARRLVSGRGGWDCRWVALPQKLAHPVPESSGAACPVPLHLLLACIPWRYAFGMNTQQIAVRLPETVLAELDGLVACGIYESRAAAVRAGIETITALANRRRTDRMIVEGYQRIPPTTAESDSAVASLRDAITEEPW